MRFLSLYRPAKKNAGPPSKEMMAAMGKLIEESMRSGELVATGGLTPGRTYLRSSNGAIEIVDGPFAEAKELLGGFAILEAKSKEHALEMVKKVIKVAGDGECELHGIMDGPPPEAR